MYGRSIAVYDADTVSLLQPLDLVGGTLPAGHIVEADTPVKAYWLDSRQMSALPERLRVVSDERGVTLPRRMQ